MADITGMLQAAAGNAGEEADPDFANTVLLLHGDGTNGAQNNTFLDSSTNNFTITRNGNTTQGTVSPFSKPDGAWGVSINSGAELLTPSDAGNAFGTGAFTIEAWIYATSGTSEGIVAQRGGSTGRWIFWVVSNKLEFRYEGSNDITSSGDVPLNEWVHVCVVREGTGSNETKLYINGVEDGVGTVSTNYTATNQIVIGDGRTDSGAIFDGFISNVRITKAAVYTTGFTPSTTPLTAIANTYLLTCQSNRFVDNSTNAFAMTPVGVNVKVTPFSPFPLTTAYSPSVNGGAGYFDGSGDYLSIADAAGLRFGTGNFTIQAWIYRSAAGAVHSIAAKGGASTGWVFQVHSDNKLRFTQTTTNIDSSGTIPAGAWTHVAVVREGTGTDETKLYINGVNDGQATVTTDFNQTEQLNIGSDRGNSNVMNGYIAGLKYVVGTAETITVPTAPPTGGTALLNFTNAGIFDNTCFNALETVGNAQIDTTTKKYGTGSIEFDGTGDYLVMKDRPEFAFGTGDFTIEMFIYLTNVTNLYYLFDWRPNGSEPNGPWCYINAGVPRLRIGGSSIAISSSAISINTWTHLCFVRNSGTIKLYLDGVEKASQANTTDLVVGTNRPLIGAQGSSTGGYAIPAFIDEFRVSRMARYTSAFTPPTKALPDIGE